MQTAEFENDLTYFRSLYSPLAARILGIVITEVNRMSYPHSFLFDDYPDALTLERMTEKIVKTVDSTLSAEAAQEESLLFVREPSEAQIYNNPEGLPWLTLLIKALLFDEIMQVRRRKRDSEFEE